MPIPPALEGGQYPYTDLNWICFKIVKFLKTVRIRICVYHSIGCGEYGNNRTKNTHVEQKRQESSRLLPHTSNKLKRLKGNGYRALCARWAFYGSAHYQGSFTGHDLFEWVVASHSPIAALENWDSG